jgi:hypothetical protein
MTSEEAKKFLEGLADDIESEYHGPTACAETLREIAIFITAKQDEVDSAWLMLEEIQKSDISNYRKIVTEKIDMILKEKRKIAKMGEA